MAKDVRTTAKEVYRKAKGGLRESELSFLWKL